MNHVSCYHRNPLRMLVAPGTWLSVAYVGSYLLVAPVLFTVVVVTTVLAWALSLIWIGLPIAIIAAVLIRGCATVERLRARCLGDEIVPNYVEVAQPGIFAQLRTRWTDQSTLRNIVYLVMYFPGLMVLDAIVFGVWIGALGLTVLPLWYWSIPGGVRIGYPQGGPEETILGTTISDLPSAIIAGICGLVLALAAAYLLVFVARLHVHAARALLGPYSDPLAPAKRVLAEPGPLSR